MEDKEWILEELLKIIDEKAKEEKEIEEQEKQPIIMLIF